jgi:hypothetical protein
MQRWTALALFALFAGSAGLLVYEMRAPAHAQVSADIPVAVDAAPPDAAAEPADASTASADGGPADGGSDAPVPIEAAALTATADAGASLLTGEIPPPLEPNAPKAVKWGCIILTYKGAQGAKQNARSREEALKLAESIAADAKQDFKAAVSRGDPGSQESLGTIQRGFLEPAPEYVLFSLAKGGVSDPVDTPRGFWIIKRND